ncbi:UTP-monosaccharide-1-phosphate uridylyltransferase [Trifolium repens]|nr:UTP-monosaccharide-1-phosphate uridylyltransferase [Trifolium repens]
MVAEASFSFSKIGGVIKKDELSLLTVAPKRNYCRVIKRNETLDLMDLCFSEAGFQVSDPVMQSKVSGNCSISHRSTLAIKGQKVFIENLSLDGVLIIVFVNDAKLGETLSKILQLFLT